MTAQKKQNRQDKAEAIKTMWTLRNKLIAALSGDHPRLPPLKRLVLQDRDNFLTASKDDPMKVSYRKPGKPIWDYNTRIKTTPAKAIRKFYFPDLPDHELASIAEALLVNLSAASVEVKSATGGALREVYMASPYGGDAGFGGTCSCMTGRKANCLDLYVNNPKRVQVLYVENKSEEENPILARALLWTLPGKEPTLLLDRLYSSNTVAERALLAHAKKLGAIIKDNPHSKLPWNGEHWTVELNWGPEDTVPYMDTFRYAEDPEPGAITFNTREVRGSVECDGTDGEAPWEDDHHRCENCGDHVHEDYTHHDEDGTVYCESCFDELFIYCEHCGSYCPNDEATRIETTRGHERYVCDDCRRDNYVECDCCSRYIQIGGRYTDSDYTVHTLRGEMTYCGSCMESETWVCENCGDLSSSSISPSHTDRNGCQYCADCVPEEEEETETEEAETCCSI